MVDFFMNRHLQLSVKCRRLDSNQRPRPYEDLALPLSYAGIFEHSSKIVVSYRLSVIGQTQLKIKHQISDFRFQATNKTVQ